MPSTSPAQARLMAACSHGATYAACPPVSVAKEFNQADTGTDLLTHKKRAMAEAMVQARTKRR